MRLIPWFAKWRGNPELLYEDRDRFIESRVDAALAEDAKRSSAIVLQEVQAQSGEVEKVSSSLRSLRERNHFAELLHESMRRIA